MPLFYSGADSLGASNNTVAVGSCKPFGERRVVLRTSLGPLIMAPLIVMNEPLVTRVVNDLVAQCRVPSFGPRRAPPVRLAGTNEAIEKRSDPQRARTGSGQRV